MEVGTPIGVILAFVAVLVSFIMEGGNPAALLSIPSLLLVFGGTFGVCMAGNRLNDVGGIFKAFLRCMLPGKKVDNAATVTELMGFADIARRDGLLALEEKAKAVDDPFLRRGLELVIDGTDSEEVSASLDMEIAALRERHKVAAKWFADAGGFAPTLGIIGTVLGLVHALEGLSDPAKLGHAISGAFIATLWGVMSANLMWLPMSNKLKRSAPSRSRTASSSSKASSPSRPGSRHGPWANGSRATSPQVSARPSARRTAARTLPRKARQRDMSRRRHAGGHDEEHENHERWLLTYADLITLLLALFMMLYAMSVLDLRKYEAFQQAFTQGMGKHVHALPGKGDPPNGEKVQTLPGAKVGRPVPTPSPISDQLQPLLNNKGAQGPQGAARQRAAQGRPAGRGHGRDGRPWAGHQHRQCRAVPDREGRPHLRRPAPAVEPRRGAQTMANPLVVEGHTDSRPIRTTQFPSNWELSTSRATSVLRYLIDKDSVQATRLSATGFADTKPLARTPLTRGWRRTGASTSS